VATEGTELRDAPPYQNVRNDLTHDNLLSALRLWKVILLRRGTRLPIFLNRTMSISTSDSDMLNALVGGLKL